MWKKIDSHEIISEVKVGTMVCSDPDDPHTYYQVEAIDNEYIELRHADGFKFMKVRPEEYLIHGHWWVKE